MDQRRTLDETIAVYALEPNIKDLFVEGTTDKALIDWFLKGNGVTDVRVYPIDLFEVPDSVLQKHGLPLGSNRSRVVALACELAGAYPETLDVLCLADRDFEDYCPTCAKACYLLLTDCNSLDLYAFTASTLEKFSTVALGGLPISTSDLILNMDSILARLYAVRLANELLGWGMKWVPFSRYARMQGLRIVFDQTEFVRAYLQKNYRWDQRRRFLLSLREIEGSLSPELGRRSRSHDFAELLTIVVRTLSKERKFGNVETLEGCLMAALESSNLRELPFFKRILALAGA
jgi:hypothetical protein